MKKIVSKIAVVLSVIFFVLSICSITSVEYLKGKIPLQETIINSTDIIYGLSNVDMSYLSYKQVPLFYIGLVLIIISSIICFEKSNKLKGVMSIILSIFTALFVTITHNYLWFLILINLYLVVTLILDFTFKDKVIVIVNVIGIIIVILNLTQLIQHFQLVFEPIDAFQMELLELSDITLKTFALWGVPYTILLIKDIVTTRKS